MSTNICIAFVLGFAISLHTLHMLSIGLDSILQKTKSLIQLRVSFPYSSPCPLFRLTSIPRTPQISLGIDENNLDITSGLFPSIPLLDCQCATHKNVELLLIRTFSTVR